LVTHARTVADVAVALERRLSHFVVMRERELSYAERGAGETLGGAVAGRLRVGLRQLHRPDLLAVAPDGGHDLFLGCASEGPSRR